MIFNPQSGMNDVLMLLLLMLLGRATTHAQPVPQASTEPSAVQVESRSVNPLQSPRSGPNGGRLVRAEVVLSADGAVILDGSVTAPEDLVSKVRAGNAATVQIKAAPGLAYAQVIPVIVALSGAGFAVELR